MQHITLEYIAGFVDGEGTFTISIGGYKHFHPRFSLSNTNLDVIKEIQKYFSMGLRIHSFYMNDNKRKVCYQLQSQNIDQVKTIARLLEPHLRQKKEQAQIIMKYPRGKCKNNGRISVTDHSIKNLQLKLRERIMFLNKKGPGSKESDKEVELEKGTQMVLLKGGKR